MKTSNALAWATISLLLTAPVLASHSSDGDPIPDAAEGLGVPCANTVTQDAFNVLLAGMAGWCHGASDYESSLFNPAACLGCSTTIVHQVVDGELVPFTDVPSTTVVPEVDQVVTTVMGYYLAGSTYCIGLENVTDPVQCVNTAPAPPDTIPPFTVPLVFISEKSVDPPPVERVSFDLSVSYRSFEANLTQRLGPGLVAYYDPVDYSDTGGVLWWALNGNQTSLDVELVLYEGGNIVEESSVSVPYLGQFLRAQQRSIDETTP
jgi:hypothetical protein